MQPIEWKEEYSVGVPELDKQHKGLIELINRLAEEGHRSSVVIKTLDALSLYAREHFSAEEALLRACGDPNLEEHEREHRAFEEWLDAIKQIYRFSTTLDPFVDTINSFLRNWLINHILKTDMAYKPLVTGRF
jgi:hemerythrin